MDSRQSPEKLVEFAEERLGDIALAGEGLLVHKGMDGLHKLDPVIDKVLSKGGFTSSLKISVMSFSSELAWRRLV